MKNKISKPTKLLGSYEFDKFVFDKMWGGGGGNKYKLKTVECGVSTCLWIKTLWKVVGSSQFVNNFNSTLLPCQLNLAVNMRPTHRNLWLFARMSPTMLTSLDSLVRYCQHLPDLYRLLMRNKMTKSIFLLAITILQFFFRGKLLSAHVGNKIEFAARIFLRLKATPWGCERTTMNS